MYHLREVVFTHGATESINLVSNSWGDTFIGKGDEIVLTVMEHHSNLVPWQALALRRYMLLLFYITTICRSSGTTLL